MKFMVDPVKCTLNAAICGIMLLFSVGAFYFHIWVLFAVFFVTFLGFLWFTLDYGSTVEIKDHVITQKVPILGMTKTYKRDDITEAGIMGTNIYYKTEDSKTGTIYLYFSPRKLDDRTRFDMGLKWPRDIIRFRYSQDRYLWAQLFWDGKLQKYHIGDLEL